MKFVWDKKRKLLFFINKLLPFKSFKYFSFFGIMVTRIKDVLKTLLIWQPDMKELIQYKC